MIALEGPLHKTYSTVYMDDLKLNSVYWPESGIPTVVSAEETEAFDQAEKQPFHIEGVFFKNEFYVTRIDDFDILESLSPYFSLPEIKNNHPWLLEIILFSGVVVLLNMIVFAVMTYYDSPDFLFLCNAIGIIFLLWVSKKTTTQHVIYELNGKFCPVGRTDGYLFSSPGEINGFPITAKNFEFKKDQNYTVHGHVVFQPEYHIQVQSVDHQPLHVSSEETKKNLRWGMLIWFVLGYVLVLMTDRFYQSAVYRDYARIVNLHENYQILNTIDPQQLSTFDSGDTIQFEGVYFSPGNRPGMLRATSEIDMPLVEQLSENLFSEVWQTIPVHLRRESFDFRTIKSLLRGKDKVEKQKVDLESEFIAAKEKVLSQPYINIDIGERKFDVKPLSLKALRANAFHLSENQRVHSNALYTRIRQLVTQYLYGANQTMQASVSFFLTDEKTLVVFIYHLEKIPPEFSYIKVNLNMYRFWIVFCSLIFLGTVYVYWHTEDDVDSPKELKEKDLSSE
ncbi:hypothetical protein KDD30_17130 (plasmid) [Photobacterium sp. GJ3]|uniref:hypothetical protein n=1 Tax=Photobacterium sp. GJ3 TaxID=2829502 RepID=UPI001B8D23C5|nr:hypothetical protein [Photobacterium sp. GJ3]QUJ69895.1 hypothetical protein KDD30_17130 [Photobacterium sp. GJ3]